MANYELCVLRSRRMYACALHAPSPWTGICCLRMLFKSRSTKSCQTWSTRHTSPGIRVCNASLVIKSNNSREKHIHIEPHTIRSQGFSSTQLFHLFHVYFFLGSSGMQEVLREKKILGEADEEKRKETRWKIKCKKMVEKSKGVKV